IFLNLHPDQLQVVNPGLLPLGVTPQNVLHTTVRRNEHLARLFHDLKLMEREGSGFDKMFEVLLSQGRPVPDLSRCTIASRSRFAAAFSSPRSSISSRRPIRLTSSLSANVSRWACWPSTMT